MALRDITQEEMLEISGYARSLSTRSKALGGEMSHLDIKLSELQDRGDNFNRANALQVKDAKADLQAVSDALKEIQKAVVMLVSKMKSAAKKEDLQRIERRIDTWAPQQLATRRELCKAVQGKNNCIAQKPVSP
jgi:predicted  nucleic acid-binding Zn-ribbon protein